MEYDVSTYFYDTKDGEKVAHFLTVWPEKHITISDEVPLANVFDIVVNAVGVNQFNTIDEIMNEIKSDREYLIIRKVAQNEQEEYSKSKLFESLIDGYLDDDADLKECWDIIAKSFFKNN